MRAHATVAALACALALAAPARAFDRGADLSSLPRVESSGALVHDARGPADALALLKRNGFTSVRLRLWHTPAAGDCDLAATLAMARRAKLAHMSVLLDLHFSDTWADPAHQTPPAAWRGLEGAALAQTAGTYVRGVLAAFVAQGTPPAAVQLGNEIDDGMLWDAARLDSPAGRAELAAVLTSAARGVRAECPKARIVIHVSAGGNAAACQRVLDPLVAAEVPFDAIGVSYYPWWHGSLDDLASTLARLASRYRRDVMVVETAYPWTLAALDRTHNIVGRKDQLIADERYAATPQGQAGFARDVRQVVEEVPDGRGVGVWWWEPAWTTHAPGGSPWENCALFDSGGALLPAARALAR